MDQLLLDAVHDCQTITTIEIVTSNPLLRHIKIGRKTIATLPIDAVESMGITQGELLTNELAFTLEQAVVKLHIRKAAQKLIKRRAYSRGDGLASIISNVEPKV